MIVFFLSLSCLVAQESKLQLRPGWFATPSFTSEYATQAAAADKRFVYAVSNTHVARYDRDNKKLLGAGTMPDAKHLNSAFVWKGKVYSAHSNYPKVPEESDIRVFDPSDDSLKMHHRFVKPPGSLVWCVRDPDDRFWWCCFAHYKDANSRTLLAKLDDQFQEKARWTFPKSVVDDWDNMSASGGIWDGKTLLVSHHHFKVLYRLGIPKEGQELELVEALACPFPGQGIAIDPNVRGGLVGIDRGKREIVFAAKK
jgi:hypothetical protein